MGLCLSLNPFSQLRAPGLLLPISLEGNVHESPAAALKCAQATLVTGCMASDLEWGLDTNSTGICGKGMVCSGFTHSGRAPSRPFPASVNKVLLEFSHAHSLTGVQSRNCLSRKVCHPLLQTSRDNLVMKSGSPQNKPK